MKDKTEEAVNAVKLLAETAKIFFDHLLELGTPGAEAVEMTSAYIKTMILSSRHGSEEGDGERD